MYVGKQFNESVKQVALLLVILFVFCVVVNGLNYFASSILGSFTLYMILRTPHRRMLEKGWNNTASTGIFLLATIVFLFLIVGGIASLIYGKLRLFNPELVVNSFRHVQDMIIQKWGYNIFSEEIIQKALAALGNILPALISATGNVLANVLMMIVVLCFMLYQSKEFESGVENFIPASKESVQMMKKETHTMIFSNAVGIPLIMLGQALTAGFGYWLLDAGDPILGGMLTSFFGLIPVVGTAGVWLPLSINLFIGGHIWQGFVLILYGALIISSVDNLVRMVFLKKHANVHPLITLFGVILGMSLFGFWGIIFGPLIISGFFLLVKIYKKEFIPNEK
jgi:predicted PurR-regulated permease PerM